MLLSDAGGKVSKRYGILIVTGNGDLLSGRSVFLIDKEGKVRYADSKYQLSPADDHDTLIKEVQALGKAAEKKESAAAPRIERLRFGHVEVNGIAYSSDVVIEGGKIRERDKKPSRDRRAEYGHTPLTPSEEIPWGCRKLIIGTGMDGRLPVVEELKEEAEKRGVKLILLETPEAVEYLRVNYDGETNAILHVTC